MLIEFYAENRLVLESALYRLTMSITLWYAGYSRGYTFSSFTSYIFQINDYWSTALGPTRGHPEFIVIIFTSVHSAAYIARESTLGS